MSNRDGSITVEVGISCTTKIDIPKGYNQYSIEEYVENEIDYEFGGLDNLEISWIDIL